MEMQKRDITAAREELMLLKSKMTESDQRARDIDGVNFSQGKEVWQYFTCTN